MKIAGILILQNNKVIETCGKKRYYKCIGWKYNKEKISCLLPYEIKSNFYKNVENKFVLFHLEQNENVSNKGTLLETVGNVSNLDAFVKWTLYANSLFFPKMKKEKILNFENHFFLKKMSEPCQDFDLPYRHEKVYTIDPENCTDFDDAFSINNEKLSIYISNVPYIFEQLSFWQEVNPQVASIYLPNGTRHLLPTFLSEKYCSLVADGKKKMVVGLDICLTTGKKTLSMCCVSILKNYTYEEKDLLQNPDFQHLNRFVKQNTKNQILDSHDVVSEMMILFNTFCANQLKSGIFRASQRIEVEQNIAPELINQICKYPYFGYYTTDKNQIHEGFQNSCDENHFLLQSYGHFSSPIRRLVDIINLTLLQQQLCQFTFSETAQTFCQEWMNKMNDINLTCQKIKKIESQVCFLNELKEKDFIQQDGIIIHYEQERKEYSVFFPAFYKTYSILSDKKWNVGDDVKCKIYYICNETTFFKKIKIEMH